MLTNIIIIQSDNLVMCKHIQEVSFFEKICKKGIIYDRTKYIKDGKRDLNITDLSDEEYTSIYDITRLCRKEN